MKHKLTAAIMLVGMVAVPMFGQTSGGRPALVATLADAREFVARYNEAAVNENAKNGGHLPLFTAEILKAVGTASSPPPAH